MVHSLHTQGTTRRATDGVGRRACPRAARNRPATVRVHPPVCAAPRHSSRAQRFDPPHPPQPPPAAGCATTPSARHPRAAVRPGWARWRSSQRRALCARTRGRRRPRRPLGAHAAVSGASGGAPWQGCDGGAGVVGCEPVHACRQTARRPPRLGGVCSGTRIFLVPAVRATSACGPTQHSHGAFVAPVVPFNLPYSARGALSLAPPCHLRRGGCDTASTGLAAATRATAANRRRPVGGRGGDVTRALLARPSSNLRLSQIWSGRRRPVCPAQALRCDPPDLWHAA